MGRRTEWQLHPGAVIGAAGAILLVPLRWNIAIFLAAFLHEACHVVILKLIKHRIFRIEIGMTGAVIETEAMEPWEELLCALAGPAGSLLLLWLRRIFPELAVCGFVQGVWNLLPLFPLDGGRALFSFLRWLFPRSAHLIMNGIQIVCGSLLVAVLVLFALRFPVIWLAAAVAAFHLAKIKISCNQSSLAVQ